MKPGRKRGQLNQSHAAGNKPKRLSLDGQLREPHRFKEGCKSRGKNVEAGELSRSVAERVMRIADERPIEDVLVEDDEWVLEFAVACLALESQKKGR